MQTRICRQLATQLSKQVNSTIQIQGVDFSPFKSVILKGLYIEDYKKDTLFYINELKIRMDSINWKKNHLYIRKLTLTKAFFNLYRNTNEELNVDILIDSLSKESLTDNSNKNWKFWISTVELSRSRFAYRTHNFQYKDFGMNYDDIYVTDIQFQAHNIQTHDDTLFFDVKKLSCKEKGGFVLQDFKGLNRITNRQWALFNVSIVSPYSKMLANRLYFNYISNQGYWRNFTKKMKLDFEFESSSISFLDLAYFNENLRGFRDTGTLSGKIYGTIYDLKGKNIDIVYGDSTRLKGQFYMNGLPYLEKTYLAADFDELTTTIADIERVYIPGFSNKHISLPKKFNNLGLIQYQGKFNGFFNDFVFYGDLNTQQGSLSSDILFNPRFGKNQLSFKGSLKTSDFNFGGLMEQKKIGRISMNIDVNGFFADNQVQGKLRGIVNRLEFYSYIYKNMTLNGEFSESKFDGKLAISDPNIDFDFRGKIDFSQKIPTMNFSSHLTKARLYPLHLNTHDPLSNLSFVLTSNFTGSGFDNANGIIEVNNIHYQNSVGDFTLDKITLDANTTPFAKSFTLNSDFVDAKVTGNYNVNKLISSIKNLVYYYLPAYTNDGEFNRLDSTNRFNFEIDLKKTLPVTKILYPAIEIAPFTKINGQINAENHQFKVDVTSSYLAYSEKFFDKLKLTLVTDEEQLVLKSRANSLLVSNNFRIYNISNTLTAKQNEFKFDWLWNNWDAITHSGFISAEGRVTRKTEKVNPITEISVLPGTLILADSIWDIQSAKITIDSSSVKFDNFKIKRKKQHFTLNGKVSKNSQDILALNFKSISLKSLEAIMGNKYFNLNGNISGYVKVSDFYNERLSNSNLLIENLEFNTDTIGNLYIISNWDKLAQKLSVSSFIHHNGKKELEIYGGYFPVTDSLNFQMDIDQFRLSLLQPYLQSYISGFTGFTSGHIRINGTTAFPRLQGKIHLEDARFKVNKLQTEYLCNDSITLTPNRIQFEQFSLFDSYGNQAALDGFIEHEEYGNPKLNLSLNAINFNVLNTQSSNRGSFYGDAYITGITNLVGTPNNLDVDISARTEKDTKLFIPLNTSSDVSESNFISFVNSEASDSLIIKEDKDETDLSGIRMNCDLDITPDASIQMILNSKTGDILRTQGNGSLRLEIDTKGEFKIFGDYSIEEGSYLFTLQDVINKRFDLENGGIITWDGNPYDATIDITALYNVKTSLYDLLLNTPNIDNTKKIPIQCKMHLSNRLNNPNIYFSIEFPTLDQQSQSILKSLFASEDEINKQILSLLVLNRFYTPEYLRASDPDFENKNSNYAVGITASELLSNQISHWLSQISNDFDLGFSYRPGDQLTSDEIHLALSTQIFNDKVTINVNGNTGTSSKQKQNNDIAADFDVNIKLDKKGKLQLKAFSRSNEKLLYEQNRNTKGFGIFYRENFNSFSGLFKKYLKFLRRNNNNP